MFIGEMSHTKLLTCHHHLVYIFEEIAEIYDIVIIEGHRGQVKQNIAFKEGKSKLKWPHGKHNSAPSLAVDVAPAPLDWKDRERFTHFAGFVLGFARHSNIPLRWGGDWDGDMNLRENSFDDLVHFELHGAV